MKLKRIEWIDISKALGIILIVVGHTLENGYIRQVIFSFHVPLFFFLSGLTYRKPREGLYSVWKKRFLHLYVPYICFSLFSIGVFVCAEHMIPQMKIFDMSFTQGLLGMIYGNARTGHMKWNEPLWFLPCLLSVYLLADILETVLSRVEKLIETRRINLTVRLKSGESFIYRKSSIIIRLAFSIVAAGISLALGRFFRSVILPFGFEAALFAFLFFQAGVILDEIINIKRVDVFFHNNLMAIFFSLLLLINVGVLSHINGFAQVKSLTFGNSSLLYIITAFCGIVSVISMSVLFCGNQMLNSIGRNTLPILLMHKFPILVFQKLISPIGNVLEKGNSIIVIPLAIIVSAITILLCLSMNSILKRIYPKFR